MRFGSPLISIATWKHIKHQVQTGKMTCWDDTTSCNIQNGEEVYLNSLSSWHLKPKTMKPLREYTKQKPTSMQVICYWVNKSKKKNYQLYMKDWNSTLIQREQEILLETKNKWFSSQQILNNTKMEDNLNKIC